VAKLFRILVIIHQSSNCKDRKLQQNPKRLICAALDFGTGVGHSLGKASGENYTQIIKTLVCEAFKVLEAAPCH
jgi:hypothetical protein